MSFGRRSAADVKTLSAMTSRSISRGGSIESPMMSPAFSSNYGWSNAMYRSTRGGFRPACIQIGATAPCRMPSSRERSLDGQCVERSGGACRVLAMTLASSFGMATRGRRCFHRLRPRHLVPAGGRGPVLRVRHSTLLGREAPEWVDGLRGVADEE